MTESFNVGDAAELKKPHACGGRLWQITRTGADIKLKCCQCGHTVMMDRVDFLKRVKRIIARGGENEQ